VAYILNIIARFFIFDLAQTTTDYNISTGGIVLGVVLGLVLPLVANVLPIKRALSKNLRESLDLYHRSANELQVTIKRLEEMGFSFNQTIVAVLLVLLGGITYYLAPMAWVYQNFTLFFFVINFILIMMILGLALISILLLPYVQLMFLNIFLFIVRGDRRLYRVVCKNLESHEGRNTKTAMMFTIALSFLIFAGSTFSLIGNLVNA